MDCNPSRVYKDSIEDKIMKSKKMSKEVRLLLKISKTNYYRPWFFTVT